MRSGSGLVTTRLGACGNEASAPFYQLPTGTVIVEPPEQRVMPPRTVAVYARVSNSENKKNLETQAERLISWCNAASAGQLPKSSKSVAVGSMISTPSSWLCSQTPKSAKSWSNTKTGLHVLGSLPCRHCSGCKGGNWSSSIRQTP